MAFNQGLLHVSRPLTDMVVSYDPGSEGFIRQFFFPRKPVAHMTDKIRQISKPDLLRVYDMQASSENKVAEIQYRLDADLNFSCNIMAVAGVLPGEDLLNADEELIHEQRTLMQLNLAMQNRMEYLAINQTLRSTSVMSSNTTLSASALWDNYSSTSSQPIDDLIAACQSVRLNTNMNPNHVVLSEVVWNVLAQHPNVLSRMPVHTVGPTGAILTPAILEQILRLDPGTVKVTARTYNTTAQGETATYKLFLGSDVIVGYTNSASLYDYSLGKEFTFGGLPGGPDGFAVYRYPDFTRGPLGSDVIKIASAVDYKVTNATAGYLLKTVLDTTKTIYGGFVD